MPAKDCVLSPVIDRCRKLVLDALRCIVGGYCAEVLLYWDEVGVIPTIFEYGPSSSSSCSCA